MLTSSLFDCRICELSAMAPWSPQLYVPKAPYAHSPAALLSHDNSGKIELWGNIAVGPIDTSPQPFSSIMFPQLYVPTLSPRYDLRG